MSTKIWTAWRVPIGRLNEFFDLANKATLDHFYECLDQLIGWVKVDEAKGRREEKRAALIECCGKLPSWWIGDRDETYIRERWEIVLEHIRATYKSGERGLYYVDASMNVWLDKRYAYIIPYGRVKLPVPLPNWIEDYHYQDQGDRPKEITARQWSARRAKWEQLCLNDWNRTRMSRTIIDFGTTDHRGEYRCSEYLAEVHLGIIPEVKP